MDDWRASDHESSHVVVLLREVVARNVGPACEAGQRCDARAGQFNDLVVDLVPAVEVQEYGAGAFFVLALVEDVQHCSLAPDVLCVSNVIQIAKFDLPKLHFSIRSPFLHFPGPLAVIRIMLGQAELNSPSHVIFKQGADNYIAAFDVFPAAWAKV